MKISFLQLSLSILGCATLHSFSQCPGIESSTDSFSPLPYTISTIDMTCGTEGGFLVDIPDVIPGDYSFFIDFDNGLPMEEYAPVDIDFSTLGPGNYTFFITENVDSVLIGAMTCAFTIEDNTTCLGDFNGDGLITGADLTGFLETYGQDPCTNCCGDFDGDGAITSGDLAGFLEVFNTSCPMAPVTGVDADTEINDVQIEDFIQNFEMADLVTIDIYPNPSVGQINIDISHIAQNVNEGQIEIVDISGRVVDNVNWTYDNKTARTNIDQLDPGTYFVLFSANGKSHSERFIVQ